MHDRHMQTFFVQRHAFCLGLKRAFCLSAHSTRALCCRIVAKSRELVVPAAAAIHVDRSDKRVCGRVGGKRRVLQQSPRAAVESDLPEVWLSRVDGLFAKTATRRTGVNGSLVGGNVISSAETSRS